MKKLLSLPPNLVEKFHKIQNVDKQEWFCSSDPVDAKLGSGGGTSWLLKKCYENDDRNLDFDEWLKSDKKILLHAGGQSRRLPSYAPSGKILAPIPVFRWSRGQKIDQNLLNLQIPLYEKILNLAPKNINTLVASGDVYIRNTKPLAQIPDADVVCYGLWTDAISASHHGVFVFDRNKPSELEKMLQKPSPEYLGTLSKSKFFLTDIGIWLLSDKAIKILNQSCADNSKYGIKNYDLYSEFGFSLGYNAENYNPLISNLKVAIITLDGGGFYHFGTSRELISSAASIQNLVNNQLEIMHKKIKPNSSIFVQNSITKISLNSLNSNIWIENSYISNSWEISCNNIITGIPQGVENIKLNDGICIDIIPIFKNQYVVRPYGIDDAFRGSVNNEKTTFLNNSLVDWAKIHGIENNIINNSTDIQSFKLFPIVEKISDIEKLIKWMILSEKNEEIIKFYNNIEKLSADEISAQANLERLNNQRIQYQNKNLNSLSQNYENSIFYQLDLTDIAQKNIKYSLPLPITLPTSADIMQQIHNQMLLAKIKQLKNEDYSFENKKAFQLLSDGIVNSIISQKENPKRYLYDDQIVWGRSPVRIDLAGGWTDTPPFSIYSGGNVVNIAVELNGQPPLQVYIKPCKDYHIILRSIDLGASETIKTFNELREFNKVGSPFSISKGALALSGFLPEFCSEKYQTLEKQLKEFGCGIEISQISALPAGSGMGTSSILASTVLSSISKFANLDWSNYDICRKTLVLEQLLTTGGGWQDQYGGVFQGIKLLQSQKGFNQNPEIRFLPDYLFTNSEYSDCHLLYYTGITRTAKNILSEIVRNMFLNSQSHLELLEEMKNHALNLCEAIQSNNYNKFGQLIKKSWEQNKMLDQGVNPPEIEHIIKKIEDYCLGYKLPGAGGGGYLYISAKDPQSANIIRKILNEKSLRLNARFTEMKISNKGLQVSVS
ncbi:MAG: bifunctional fucokinase/L-fucose-1-P-guanylyltransferase [Bacteroidales bacterium]|nr:bifunctional fucokinase/L-fucose-1-P-guanylyltransferase [Bacteroidales bacterium]